MAPGGMTTGHSATQLAAVPVATGCGLLRAAGALPEVAADDDLRAASEAAEDLPTLLVGAPPVRPAVDAFGVC